MSAKIIIRREKGILSGNGGILKVFIDHKEVDEMVNKTTFFVEAGVYAVQVKMRRNLVKTQILIVKVNDGSDINLIVRNGIKYYSILYTLFLLSLIGNLFFLLAEIRIPKWYSIFQLSFAIGFTIYMLSSYLFKNGMVRILEETTNKE